MELAAFFNDLAAIGTIDAGLLAALTPFILEVTPEAAVLGLVGGALGVGIGVLWFMGNHAAIFVDPVDATQPLIAPTAPTKLRLTSTPAGGGAVLGTLGDIPVKIRMTSNWTGQTGAIQSAQFSNVHLRLDGSHVTKFLVPGSGVVNCQFTAGPWEKFRFVPLGGDEVAIGSVQFPNVYLRMDGGGVNHPTGSGGGSVNCQFGAGPWERFRLVPQGDGTVAITSVHFPNVVLRMDGSGVDHTVGAGAGSVNCQFGAGPWEKFRIVHG